MVPRRPLVMPRGCHTGPAGPLRQVVCFHCGTSTCFNPSKPQDAQPHCKSCGSTRKVWKFIQPQTKSR